MKKRTTCRSSAAPSFSKARRRKGLTLMEVMLVLVILGILGSMAAMFISGAQDDAMRRATATEISTLETALKQYRMAMYSYPSGQDGLQALIEQPSGDQNNRWRGPYLEPGNDLKDPWGNEYDVSFPTITGGAQGILIKSAGPDGAMNTEDDISSNDQV